MDAIGTKYLFSIVLISAVLIGLHTIGEDLSFADLDTNSDGVISYKEAEKHPILYQNFKKTDLNKDDSISLSGVQLRNDKISNLGSGEASLLSTSTFGNTRPLKILY